MMAAESQSPFDLPPPPPEPPASTTGDLETLSLDGNDPLLHPPPSPPSPTNLLTTDDIDLDDDDDDIVTKEITFSTNTTTSTNSSSSSPPEFINITVSDPQKEHDPAASVISGSATFVSYLITSRSVASPSSAEFRVRRRFRDVVALADRLAAAHKGLFVPARPDKSVVEGQVMRSQEFVGHRRVAIEKYLRRLAAHPVIGRTEELRAFLKTPGRFVTSVTAASAYEDEDEEWDRVRGNGGGVVSGGTAAVVAKGGRDLFGIFKELKQTVSNGFVAVRPPPVEEEKDQEFLTRKAKLEELEQQLTTTSQQV